MSYEEKAILRFKGGWCKSANFYALMAILEQLKEQNKILGKIEIHTEDIYLNTK